MGLKARWMAHLQRLGGMLVRPGPALRQLIDHPEGKLGEVAMWLVFLAAVVSPTRTGRAMLLVRQDPVAGLLAFVQQLQVRLVGPLLGVLLAAALLAAASRRRLGFDRGLDVAAFTLTPLLLLTALGVVLRSLGYEVWFLPHRSIQGVWPAASVQVAVAYGWSVGLLGLAIREVRRPLGGAHTEAEGSASGGAGETT